MICKAFGCTPSQAKRESISDVRAVLDYRAAIDARETMNDTTHGPETMALNPHLGRILTRMHEAAGVADAETKVMSVQNAVSGQNAGTGAGDAVSDRA